MIADSSWIEHGRGDAGHSAPPPRHVRDEAELALESLRSLAVDTRKALDAAHARCEALAAREQETRTLLAESQEALHARDAEYAGTIRTLLDRLSELEHIDAERDAVHRQVEARCRSLELRIEHVVMELPRRIARAIRACLTRRAN